jgi:hypothetical protein
MGMKNSIFDNNSIELLVPHLDSLELVRRCENLYLIEMQKNYNLINLQGLLESNQWNTSLSIVSREFTKQTSSILAQLRARTLRSPENKLKKTDTYAENTRPSFVKKNLKAVFSKRLNKRQNYSITLSQLIKQLELVSLNSANANEFTITSGLSEQFLNLLSWCPSESQKTKPQSKSCSHIETMLKFSITSSSASELIVAILECVSTKYMEIRADLVLKSLQLVRIHLSSENGLLYRLSMLLEIKYSFLWLGKIEPCFRRMKEFKHLNQLACEKKWVLTDKSSFSELENITWNTIYNCLLFEAKNEKSAGDILDNFSYFKRNWPDNNGSWGVQFVRRIMLDLETFYFFDEGKGNSSLAFLPQMAVHFISFDKQIVKNKLNHLNQSKIAQMTCFPMQLFARNELKTALQMTGFWGSSESLGNLTRFHFFSYKKSHFHEQSRPLHETTANKNATHTKVLEFRDEHSPGKQPPIQKNERRPQEHIAKGGVAE